MAGLAGSKTCCARRRKTAAQYATALCVIAVLIPAWTKGAWAVDISSEWVSLGADLRVTCTAATSAELDELQWRRSSQDSITDVQNAEKLVDTDLEVSHKVYSNGIDPDRFDVQRSADNGSYTLIVRHTTLDDIFKYWCRYFTIPATTPDEITSLKVDVRVPAVASGVWITYNGNNYTDGSRVSLLDANESAVLACRVAGVRPEPNATWTASSGAVALNALPVTHSASGPGGLLVDTRAGVALVVNTLPDNSVILTCAVSTGIGTDVEISVQLLIYGEDCVDTGYPDNCICSSNQQASNCSCSLGYFGRNCSRPDSHRCRHSAEGPICNINGNDLPCPAVGDRCTLPSSAPSVALMLTPGTDPSEADQDVTCTDLATGIRVNLTEARFGVGAHRVLCSPAHGAYPGCLLYINVIDLPTMHTPSVGDVCTAPGQATVTVAWPPIVAEVANGSVALACHSVGGDGALMNVGTAGGALGAGTHRLNCTATKWDACVASVEFAVEVKAQSLVPYGTQIGDSILSTEHAQDAGGDIVSRIFSPPNFFPLCDELHKNLYFTHNGVVLFTNGSSPDGLDFARPSSSYFTGSHKMVAPFWTAIDSSAFSNTSNVFWQEYNQYSPSVNHSMLDSLSDIVAANVTNFSANWAIVITWSNVRAVGQSNTSTFQVVLLTDGLDGFAVFNYDPCGAGGWPLDAVVVRGATCGRPESALYVHTPDQPELWPGGAVGNSGRLGRWLFHVGSLTGSAPNARLTCHDWYHRQRASDADLMEAALRAANGSCPFSPQSALADFRWDETEEEHDEYPARCFLLRSQSVGNPGPRCCYENQNSAFLSVVRTAIVASVLERNPTRHFHNANGRWQRDSFLDEEIEARNACCLRSTLCHLYEELRPLLSFYAYAPPTGGWGFGDPHFRTVDGLVYTFNGLGEYTLISLSDSFNRSVFEIQARTRRTTVPGSGEIVPGTIYSAIAAGYSGEQKVEIRVTNGSSELLVTVDGAEVDVNSTADSEVGNVTLRREGDNPVTVSATFSSDVRLVVSLSGLSADVSVSLDQSFKGLTAGLLGVWDDDQGNDLLRYDGALQMGSGPNGTLEDADFFAFGETWRISEGQSLFTYAAGESWASHNTQNYTPTYLGDLEAAATPAELDRAKSVCGNSTLCLYDTLSTNDTGIGAATLAYHERLTLEALLAANTPPSLVPVESINVTVGSAFTLQLQAMDPDGDTVTFNLIEPIDNASITEQGGLFTWTPYNASRVRVGFLATDGKVNVTAEPIVGLCGCMNGGTCRHGQYSDENNLVTHRFGVELCVCPTGSSGPLCEVDIDACADDPCYEGVVCTDHAPPLLNSSCGPCPDGFSGNGTVCTEVHLSTDGITLPTYTNEAGQGGGDDTDNTAIIVGCTVGGVALLAVSLGLCYYIKAKGSKAKVTPED